MEYVYRPVMTDKQLQHFDLVYRSSIGLKYWGLFFFYFHPFHSLVCNCTREQFLQLYYPAQYKAFPFSCLQFCQTLI